MTPHPTLAFRASRTRRVHEWRIPLTDIATKLLTLPMTLTRTCKMSRILDLPAGRLSAMIYYMSGLDKRGTPKHSVVVPARQDAALEDFEQSLAFMESQFDAQAGFPSHLSDYRDFSRPYRSPPEVFTTGIIAQCLVDAGATSRILDGCLRLMKQAFNAEGFVHFFQDRRLLDADLDCTAVAHSLCLRLGAGESNVGRTVDALLSNTNEEGVLEVYYRASPEHRGRVDHCVLANVMYLLCQLDRFEAAAPSWRCLTEFLESDAYLFGTRYYPSPDVFLYFVSRLVRDFPEPRATLLEPLRKRLLDRQGADTPCFDRALRIAACANVGLAAGEDLLVVASARRDDGSWAISPFFRYGRTPRYFGSEALSTMVGAQALASAASLSKRSASLGSRRDAMAK